MRAVRGAAGRRKAQLAADFRCFGQSLASGRRRGRSACRGSHVRWRGTQGLITFGWGGAGARISARARRSATQGGLAARRKAGKRYPRPARRDRRHARYTGTRVVKVNPAYTSQRCSACGFVTEGNRESQAVFRCKAAGCGYRDHADVNAAKKMGLEQLHLAARSEVDLEDFYGRIGWKEVGRWPGSLRLAAGDDRDEILI
ncbi:zinc ribbon domain-containing protein [Streptomyces sp. NPDC001698]|uniref:zinc ribbon domain-containing protein n=1 Tax=unclassified Streptomyces TaxID=2593676 RepID=UPI0036C57BCB